MSRVPPPPPPAGPESEAEAAGVLPARQRRRAATRILPPSRFTGPIPWVLAILVALVVIAGSGGLALRNLAASANAGVGRAVSVQVIEPNPDLRGVRAAAAVRALTRLDGVQAVRQVPEAELAAMLEPWLGDIAASGDVPIPALIDVELAGPASPAAIARIETALKAAVPRARVDAQGEWLRPVANALRALQYLALGLIALVALAAAAAVWLAARGAFSAARDTVEIMHLLGATKQQIAGMFLRDVLREATLGATLGTLAGVAAVWALGQQFAALDSGLVSGGGLRLTDWLAIAAIPLAALLLALATTRITLERALGDML